MADLWSLVRQTRKWHASVEFHRQRIAFYGSTRAYWPVLEQHDLLDVGQQLNVMARNNQWQDMPAVVSDDMLQLFCAIGRHDQIADEIARQFGGLSDAISDSASYDMPGQLPGVVIEDIQAIPVSLPVFVPQTNRCWIASSGQ